MMRIACLGHAVFAATLVALGILGLFEPDFTTIWQSVPKGFPAQTALLYLSALTCIACGAGLFWQRTAALAARVLFFYMFLWMLAFKVRIIILYPLVEGAYQSWGENAVLVAGAWVFYAWFATDSDRRHLGLMTAITGERGVRMAQVLYGLALIGFGFSHFAYLELTAPLVPIWLGFPVGWAYFTGAAYLAAALGILTGVGGRLAATLSAIQMGGFTFLVWIPIALSGDIKTSQWTEFVVSWALTAAAWVVVDSYRGMAWFPLPKRKAA
jgi:uncharacterized membrane protein